MASFEIHGGKPLKGELYPQGAKNEALQVLCAPLLTPEKVTIANVPDIVDVNKLISLLQTMGVKVEKVEKGTYIFQAKDINLEYLETEDFKKRASALRGSIMIVGPLLARFGKGFIPKPGGDKIGRRRLDTHFFGFMKLGAKFNYSSEDGGIYEVDASELQGASAGFCPSPAAAALCRTSTLLFAPLNAIVWYVWL
ncbi:MAG: hypothetical protein EBR54_08600 [Flavobacteriia bacterium]|nr:hypothetical protein [Flavobacteriia bacterium]